MSSLSTPLYWGDGEMITSLSLPRKYTSTHNDEKAELYLTIDHHFNKKQLSTDEVINVESQVLGKWKSAKRIELLVFVSTEKNPQAEIRNKIIRAELINVLRQIGLAETGLVALHPKLGKAKIYITFRSIDPKYQSYEYFGRLRDYVSQYRHNKH